MLLGGSRLVHRLGLKCGDCQSELLLPPYEGCFPALDPTWCLGLPCTVVLAFALHTSPCAVTQDTFLTLPWLLDCILEGRGGPHSFHLDHEIVLDKQNILKKLPGSQGVG